MNFFRSRVRLAGAVLVLVMVAAACGADAQVAEVGDQTLTEGGLVDLLEDPIGDPAQIGDQVLTPDGLDALVDGTIDKREAAGAITGWARNELWYSELAAREFEIGESFFAAARAELETIALADPTVPDLDTARGQMIIRSQALAPVVAAYLLDVVGVEPAWPVQLCSSHILLETEEEALAVIDRLEAGEDFAALAAELSIGPSGPAGGDLGCVDPSSFVSEYVEGAALVDAPGVSAPVQSQFGWHVIDVRSFGATPSEEPAAIQDAVFSTSEFTELRDDVFAREVVVDPAYGTWDPDSLSVIPTDS